MTIPTYTLRINATHRTPCSLIWRNDTHVQPQKEKARKRSCADIRKTYFFVYTSHYKSLHMSIHTCANTCMYIYIYIYRYLISKFLLFSTSNAMAQSHAVAYLYWNSIHSLDSRKPGVGCEWWCHGIALHGQSWTKIPLRMGSTLRELTYPPNKAYLKMIFLFPRWDMLVSWKVS